MKNFQYFRVYHQQSRRLRCAVTTATAVNTTIIAAKPLFCSINNNKITLVITIVAREAINVYYIYNNANIDPKPNTNINYINIHLRITSIATNYGSLFRSLAPLSPADAIVIEEGVEGGAAAWLTAEHECFVR